MFQWGAVSGYQWLRLHAIVAVSGACTPRFTLEKTLTIFGAANQTVFAHF
jgi:hypothetical protein